MGVTMKKTFFMILAVALFLCCGEQPTAVAEEPNEYAKEFQERRSSFTEKQRAKFDQLWKTVARQRQLGNTDKVDEALDEILQLVPDSIPIWQYAAWSVGFFEAERMKSTDEKYQAARRGILLLLKGVDVNPDNPILLYELGFYSGTRIGLHENGEMRELFRHDHKLHKILKAYIELDRSRGVGGLPDNWLVAKSFYRQAILAYTEKDKSIGNKFPLLVFSGVPSSLSRYAESLELDGRFGDEVAIAWRRAAESWRALENRPFKNEWLGDTIRLSDSKDLEERIHAGETLVEKTRQKYEICKTRRLIVNLDAWQQRCEVEQTELVRGARQSLYRANVRLMDSKNKGTSLEPARILFDEGFHAWKEVFEHYEDLIDNVLMCEGLIQDIEIYQKEFYEGRSLPTDFPLGDVWEHWTKSVERASK